MDRNNSRSKIFAAGQSSDNVCALSFVILVSVADARVTNKKIKELIEIYIRNSVLWQMRNSIKF